MTKTLEIGCFVYELSGSCVFLYRGKKTQCIRVSSILWVELDLVDKDFWVCLHMHGGEKYSYKMDDIEDAQKFFNLIANQLEDMT